MRKSHRLFGLGTPDFDAQREKGAALVEMALLLPILLLLVIGVFELGGAFKTYLTTSNAVRDGTRILSARGTDATSDCVALGKAIEALTLANDLDQLDRVEIFQANPSTGDAIGGTINTYTYSFGDPAVCTSTPPNCGSWDCEIKQTPTSRNAFVGPGVSPDLIGMRIVYDHSWFTGFPPFNGFITVDEKTISRLEPEGFAP